MTHIFRIALLALTLAQPLLVMAAELEADRWNLKDLYPNQAAWDRDASTLERQLKGLSTCAGRLAQSPERFKHCLDLNAQVLKRFYRLYGYASQFRDEDTSLPSGQDLKQRADVLGTRVEEAGAFLRPEILSIGRSKVNTLLKANKASTLYTHWLDDILRSASHTLDRRGEELVANFSAATGAADAVYSTLTDADMPWPKVSLSDGSEIVLDQTAYEKYRALGKRSDRKTVFDAFWSKWREFERTFGVTLYEQLKKDAALAKIRHYPDSLAQALDANKLPRAVYDTLLTQAELHLPTLHRYFKLRARMMGLSEMRYYDIYPPMVSSNLKYPIGLSTELMLASVKPLGEDYVHDMAQGTKSGWMDVYPRPRKRSGAYMNGSAYDVHPYLLLNHNDDYESLTTLAHEWGHAMHSYLSIRSQPFINAEYPTFTAEIASTTNELLLLDHMLKIAKDDSERMIYLDSALENLRGTFFRQAMFAAFERDVHSRVDKGESLTGEALTKIYGDILKRYHGDTQGVVKIDELYAIEWAFIPHFYNRFYVFQYATSVTAAATFANAILNGTPLARERYLNILRAGGSNYPYELVKAAGVDLATPAPYQAVVARMNSIMDQIEAIQAAKALE